MRLLICSVTLLLGTAVAGVAACQTLHTAAAPLSVAEYVLRFDSAGTAAFHVEIRLRGAPDTLRLAMPAHPEYDDRFWRYVRDVRVSNAAGDVPVVREDSMVWRAVVPGGEAVVRYRVEPPPRVSGHGSWRAYLAPNTGLVGGPHAFMFVVGRAYAPIRLTLHLPPRWTAATGLTRLDDTTYVARDVGTLIDNPILIGQPGALAYHTFVVNGVPHDVAFAAGGAHVPFDTATVVGALRRLAVEAHALFGRFPYRRFVFLLQDDAAGGLEHGRSVSLGVSSAGLARGDLIEFLSETAHEYLHSWNEVYLRPRGWGGLSYRPSPPTREVWWMEGVTISYADLLTRRAGLPTQDASRSVRLARLIGDYLDAPGNAQVSPEEAGWRSGEMPGVHPGLRADVYLQGELLGALLDLRVRETTRNARSLDDAMRRLMKRSGGAGGYTGTDVERAVGDVCRCDMRRFFAAYVRGAGPLPFDESLRAAGLHLVVDTVPAVDSAGHSLADRRVWAYVPQGETAPRLFIEQPDGAWARAGLRAGDRVLRWNDTPVATMRDFRVALDALNLGDRVEIAYERAGRAGHATVEAVGYRVHRARFVARADATSAQRRVRRTTLLDVP